MVYLGFLSDIVINNILDLQDAFGMFSIGFLKTCVFYIIYSIICIKQTHKFNKMINESYISVMREENELMECIMIKHRMIKYNLYIVLFQTTLFIIGGTTISYLTQVGSDNPITEAFNFILDSFCLVLVLINLRPRDITFKYDGISVEFEDYNSIYKVSIKKDKLKSFYGLNSGMLDKDSFQGGNLVISADNIKTKDIDNVVIVNPYYISHEKDGNVSTAHSSIASLFEDDFTAYASDTSVDEKKPDSSGKEKHLLNNLSYGRRIKNDDIDLNIEPDFIYE